MYVYNKMNSWGLYLTVTAIFFCLLFLILKYYLKYVDISNYDSVVGTRINGIKLAGFLGFPTVNVNISKNIRCGFYRGITKYGNVTIVVGKNNTRRADLHFDIFDPIIDTLHTIEITNLVRIINSDSDIISTYNSGCDC